MAESRGRTLHGCTGTMYQPDRFVGRSHRGRRVFSDSSRGKEVLGTARAATDRIARKSSGQDTNVNLTPVDWLLMAIYFAFVLGIGVVLKRYVKNSSDFFLAGRSLPAWICGLAFLSANLGAQEVIGMAASG